MKIVCDEYPSRRIKSKVNRIFKCALKALNQPHKLIMVELSFVSLEKILALNLTKRGINSPTDVLSFPLLELKAGSTISEDMLEYGEKYINLGCIAICTDKAEMQAIEYNHSLEREICFLALHGLLHLLGFDHMNEFDEDIMMSFAKKILAKQGVKRQNG